MTLRVEISIIPFGDEDKKRVIETLNISNITFKEGCSATGEDFYVIEHNDYKNYNEDTPRVHHQRKDGALTLVKLALKKLGY